MNYKLTINNRSMYLDIYKDTDEPTTIRYNTEDLFLDLYLLRALESVESVSICFISSSNIDWSTLSIDQYGWEATYRTREACESIVLEAIQYVCDRSNID